MSKQKIWWQGKDASELPEYIRCGNKILTIDDAISLGKMDDKCQPATEDEFINQNKPQLKEEDNVASSMGSDGGKWLNPIYEDSWINTIYSTNFNVMPEAVLWIKENIVLPLLQEINEVKEYNQRLVDRLNSLLNNGQGTVYEREDMYSSSNVVCKECNGTGRLIETTEVSYTMLNSSIGFQRSVATKSNQGTTDDQQKPNQP